MKNEPIRYLGLDVHRSTVVASVRDEQGKVVMKATVATEEKAIVALVKSAGARVHGAFEEGAQAQWLHDLLIGHAERVVVCNVRGRDAMRNANDRIDADEMSKRLRDGSLKPVFHGAPEMLTLKELVRCYSNLVQDATRVMLRIKALSSAGPRRRQRLVGQPARVASFGLSGPEQRQSLKAAARSLNVRSSRLDL